MKCLFVLFGFIFSSHFLMGQISIDIQAGANLTRVISTGFKDLGYSPGYTFGVALSKGIKESKCSFMWTSSISNENAFGIIGPSDGSTDDIELKLYLDYWDNGFHADFIIFDGLSLAIGVEAGYLLLSRADYIGNTLLNGNFSDDRFNRIQWSLSGTVNQKLGKHFALGFQYVYGLTDISANDPDGTGFSTNPPVDYLEYVRTFQFCVRYRI